MKQKISDLLKKTISLAICFICLNVSANEANEAKEQAEIWGKLNKVSPSSKEFKKYKYFISFKVQNKSHAYPLEVTNKEKLALLKGKSGQTIKVTGQVVRTREYIEGKFIQFISIKPSEIKTLALSDLKPKELKDLPPRNKKVLSQSENPNGGIELPDSFTNAAIFAAGAALIGSILVK